MEPGSRDVQYDRRFVRRPGQGFRIWLRLPDGLRTAPFIDVWWGKGRSGIWKLRWMKGQKWPT